MAAPGWYPDVSGTTLHWWNGSFYSGQTWEPAQDAPLHDVVVTSIHAKVPLRAELMKLLGMPKQEATDILAALPSVVATHLDQTLAQTVHDAITNVHGVSTRHCEAEIRQAGTVSALLGGGPPATAAAARACSACGFALAADDLFCSECGRPA